MLRYWLHKFIMTHIILKGHDARFLFNLAYCSTQPIRFHQFESDYPHDPQDNAGSQYRKTSWQAAPLSGFPGHVVPKAFGHWEAVVVGTGSFDLWVHSASLRDRGRSKDDTSKSNKTSNITYRLESRSAGYPLNDTVNIRRGIKSSRIKDSSAGDSNCGREIYALQLSSICFYERLSR